MVQDHVAKVLADAAEHLREPGENGFVRDRPEVEWRRQEHRLRPPSQRRSRALGRLLDRAGDHALDELFRRYASPHEPGRRRLALAWRNDGPSPVVPKSVTDVQPRPSRSACVGGKPSDIDLAVAPERGHQSGTDAEAQRVTQTRSLRSAPARLTGTVGGRLIPDKDRRTADARKRKQEDTHARQGRRHSPRIPRRLDRGGRLCRQPRRPSRTSTWKKFAGTTLEVNLIKGPRGDLLQRHAAEFTELTGIKVCPRSSPSSSSGRRRSSS